MSRRARFSRLLLLGFVGCVVASARPDAPTARWDQLRRGMEAAAVVQAVGHPLFKTGGKLCQTWIYDRAGEILIANGVVIAITRPK